MLSTSRHAPGAYNSISHGAREIWNSEGIPGFYRGLVPSLFGVSHGAIQFMAYEKLKIWRAKILAGVGDDDEDLSTHLLLNRKSNLSSIGASVGKGLKGAHETPVRAAEQREQEVELSNWDFLTLSAVSKMFAGSVTYPYQVVRARLQTYDAPQKYKGAMDVVRQVWALEGLAGFYKGCVSRVVDVDVSSQLTAAQSGSQRGACAAVDVRHFHCVRKHQALPAALLGRRDGRRRRRLASQDVS